ncbi:hypothetical protein AB205_0042640 [Aquarana catesbeiana]|uniref:DRBM domain-containing protein n=1 Tax=Aquarana catesbeiana TaxID=8400 RepID=A0A2G9R9G5_AQUCT|nr:hypothetical protein AB205_0042640 [Aquarana catesbeiana]
MSQVQNAPAALSGSLLSKKPHSALPQSLGIPPTAIPLPSEHAGRPHQSSALPPSSVTSGNAVAVSSNMANPKEKTPMCLVNELARFNKVQPEYKLLSEQGPAHSKTFTVQLTLGDQNWEAEGTSIKKAQHAAAAKALEGTKYPKPTARPSRGEGKNPGTGLYLYGMYTCTAACHVQLNCESSTGQHTALRISQMLHIIQTRPSQK